MITWCHGGLTSVLCGCRYNYSIINTPDVRELLGVRACLGGRVSWACWCMLNMFWGCRWAKKRSGCCSSVASGPMRSARYGHALVREGSTLRWQEVLTRVATCMQIFCGIMADRLGGKTAILIGACGVALFSVVNAVLFMSGNHSFGFLVVLYALNNTLQPLGSLSVRVCAAVAYAFPAPDNAPFNRP